jgi:hypothetical protein
MKRLFSIITILLFGVLLASAPQPKSVIVTNASTTVPALLGDGLMARTWIFNGFKDGRTTNTTTVWLQLDATNNAAAVPIAPGGSVAFHFDFSEIKWYFSVGTSGDGLSVLLVP